MVIYKYDIPADNEFKLELPKGAKILKFDAQKDIPVIWALVNSRNPTEERSFRLYGTGHPIVSNRLKYLGTCQVRGGTLVFHLFECK